MVNKDEFFREVTVRICSSLQIETSLRSAFEYLRQHFPLESLFFNILDHDLSAIRRVAHAGRIKIPDEIIPLPEKLWALTQAPAPHQEFYKPVIMNSSVSHEIIRYVATLIKSELKGNSVLVLPLWIGKELIGNLVLRAKGEGRYTQDHLDLIAIVAEPFAIALS